LVEQHWYVEQYRMEDVLAILGEQVENTYRQHYAITKQYYQSKRYGPVVVALEGSVLQGNTLATGSATAFWPDLNRKIPSGLIVPHVV